jgi:hypothetical protein
VGKKKEKIFSFFFLHFTQGPLSNNTAGLPESSRARKTVGPCCCCSIPLAVPAEPLFPSFGLGVQR